MSEQSLRVVGKGGHEALLPTHPAVWDEALNRFPRTGYWFPAMGQRSGPVRPGTVSAGLRRLMLECGMPEGHAHRLRHTYGTEVLKASGGSIRVAQELLRHASPRTTAMYTLIDDAEQRKAMLALPDFSISPVEVPSG